MFRDKEPAPIHTIDQLDGRLYVRQHIEKCVVTNEAAEDTLKEFCRLVIRYGIQCGLAPHHGRK